jgi:SAM-dependent methyltransferase
MTNFLIDYAARWREQVAAEHAQYHAVIPSDAASGDFWAQHTARFRAVENDATRDPFMAFLLPQLRVGMRVLDVGSGAGRYALPLARAGMQVTALDPSAGMLAALCADAEAQGLAIATHAGAWETAEVAAADVVICAHVLYALQDPLPFLRKLDAAASGRVFVLLGYEPPICWLEPYWQLVYGIARIRLPGAIDALAVLHQLGIDAALTPLGLRQPIGYATLDDALGAVRQWLKLRPEPARDAALLAEIREQFVPTRTGFRAKWSPRLAVLSWGKAP